MTDTIHKIYLKPGKENSIKRRHPWIFSGAIGNKTDNLSEGDIVQVCDSKGVFLALGHYQPGTIAIRIFTFDNTTLNADFWKTKIEKAWNLRKSIGLTDNPDTNAFRLIHGEGDELPGLVADFFNGTLVVQFHSTGLYTIRESLFEAFREVIGSKLKAIYEKSSNTMPFKSPFKPQDGFSWGSSDENVILEYGNKFKIDWVEGQKTGFFLDQRENRNLLGQFAKGREVLNMFCYTGGFSVYALRGGAKMVHSVDSSAKAIALTNENIALNGFETLNHEAIVADGLDYMRDIKDKYDLIILDPPAFAKHNAALDNALQAYKRINQKAIEQIRSGGVLFTFSCSQVVTKELFRQAIFVAAANAGRSVRILHQLTQPADHPVSIFHPEGEYLKGLVVYIE